MRLLFLAPATAAALLVSLTACTTMTAEQCVAADWQAIGYEDAIKGRAAGNVTQHASACADHSVAPDMTAYATGHAEGARAFCTPDNGFKHGLTGGTNHNICPDDLSNAFSVTYEAGRGLRTRKQAVATAKNDLTTIERRMQRLENDFAHNEKVLATLSLKPADRAKVQADVNTARNEHQRLSKQRKRAQEKLIRTQRDHDTYRSEIEARFFTGS
ncbi:MAG: DUF2799 domain-containing protein [Alphaproteobacteria bacterium]|nr:DUF2799 domain-containing protein [Alphaproteobacteria bacterium]